MQDSSSGNPTQRWVIKVGSAVLTENGYSLSVPIIASIADQIASLRATGVEVVLVSSGAIAAGLGQLGITIRPKRLDQLQAAAAVGQAALMQAYDDAFSPFQIPLAQVLLTHADIANRERYLNAKNTLRSLLSMNILTVVNENDTVATDEICFGDNDNIAALVANLVDADVLVLLTDQAGLFDCDPRVNPDAELVRTALAGDPALTSMASGAGELGSGGMLTKLSAAQKAANSGADTVIADGRRPKVLIDIYQGNEVGSRLLAKQRVASRKQWMAGQLHLEGSLSLDNGAVKVIREQGSSLLPVGVTKVSGDFKRGSLVRCLDEHGNEVARGLVNYTAKEAAQLIGVRSERLSERLGYEGDEELIHRDNLVVSAG